MTRTLHLGCGRKKRPGAIGADMNALSDADVICDFDAANLPFAANQFDSVICEHVLEHLEGVIHAVEEIHRVAKAGGILFVQVPHFSSVFYYSDPTHRHPFGLHTFDYFIAGTAVRSFNYSPAEYRLRRAEFPPPPDAGALKRWLFQLINRHQDFYERHLAFILPRHALEFELEVVKNADRN